ncbi:hypothetical protein [Paraliobacillus ryukyuensis]|nr:hypothetical protein [Paraliobacillus ryukyuensis]
MSELTISQEFIHLLNKIRQDEKKKGAFIMKPTPIDHEKENTCVTKS